MSVSHFAPRTLDAVAAEYARSRRNRLTPVSMKAAIRAVRTMCPHDAHTDHELASIIAGKMVHYGQVVDFDQSPLIARDE